MSRFVLRVYSTKKRRLYRLAAIGTLILAFLTSNIVATVSFALASLLAYIISRMSIGCVILYDSEEES